MEDELLLTLRELIESINHLAEPTELDNKFYNISHSSLFLSIAAIFYSMYVNYDVNRMQCRVSLFQDRLALAKEMELHLARWEQRIKIPTLQVKMPCFESKQLIYLFDESIYDLYCSIISDYDNLLLSKIVTNPNIHLILTDIQVNKEDLSEKIDYYLEIQRERDPLTVIQVIKFFNKEKRLKRIKKNERKSRIKGRKERERQKKRNLELMSGEVREEETP